jgi:tetratricopeptide (TPR) repeat protein
MNRAEMLKEVLAANPNDAFARYGLALEYAGAGDTEGALAEFGRLLEANPDYTPGYFMAAQTLARAGRTKEARKMLEAGIACARRTGNSHAEAEMNAMLEELAGGL